MKTSLDSLRASALTRWWERAWTLESVDELSCSYTHRINPRPIHVKGEVQVEVEPTRLPVALWCRMYMVTELPVALDGAGVLLSKLPVAIATYAIALEWLAVAQKRTPIQAHCTGAAAIVTGQRRSGLPVASGGGSRIDRGYR